MIFIIIVKTSTQTNQFYAIAETSASLFGNVYDTFGVCSVSIKTWRKQRENH